MKFKNVGSSNVYVSAEVGKSGVVVPPGGVVEMSVTVRIENIDTEKNALIKPIYE
jgi:hypothetical protein